MTRRPPDELALRRRARRELRALAERHPELTGTAAQARLGSFLDEGQEFDMAKDSKLTEALYVRVAPEDIERLDALAARITIASRNAIARAAMRIGLDELEKDPARLLSAPPPKRGGRRR